MNADLQKIQKIFKSLDEENQRTLLAFGAFLQERVAGSSAAKQEQMKQDLPRPQKESVVGALQRLKETYPMIDTDVILSDAAGLVSQHILQGRAAGDVIDELEQKFTDLYHHFQAEQNKDA